MTQKIKLFVLVAIVLVAAIVLVNPFNSKINKLSKFEVNQNPTVDLQKSINNGKPVFLEFYASW